MKALPCPNCGSGEFEELAGKRQCIFCGTEFEVDGEGVAPIPMVICDFDGRTAVGACFDYNSTGSREQNVGFKPDILIVKRSGSGVAAKEWDSLNHRPVFLSQLEAVKLALGRMFLSLFRGFTELLAVRVP